MVRNERGLVWRTHPRSHPWNIVGGTLLLHRRPHPQGFSFHMTLAAPRISTLPLPPRNHDSFGLYYLGITSYTFNILGRSFWISQGAMLYLSCLWLERENLWCPSTFVDLYKGVLPQERGLDNVAPKTYQLSPLIAPINISIHILSIIC